MYMWTYINFPKFNLLPVELEYNCFPTLSKNLAKRSAVPVNQVQIQEKTIYISFHINSFKERHEFISFPHQL